MTVPTVQQSYALGVGSVSNSISVPVYQTRAPVTTDVLYPLGKRWINTISNEEYTLTSFSVSNGFITANWEALGGAGSSVMGLQGNTGGEVTPTAGVITIVGTGSLSFAGSGSTLTGSITAGTGFVSTLTGGTGGAISPTAGNINIEGTTNEITTVGSGSSITISIPTGFIAPGSISSTTSLTGGTGVTAITGNVMAINGNLVLGTAGNKINSVSVGTTAAAGANSFGSVALVGGTITVATTAVTASSLIFLTCQALGTVTTPSALCVSAQTAGTSFVITASQGTDTSTIAWFIVN